MSKRPNKTYLIDLGIHGMIDSGELGCAMKLCAAEYAMAGTRRTALTRSVVRVDRTCAIGSPESEGSVPNNAYTDMV